MPMSYIDIEKARMLAGGSNSSSYYKNTMQQRVNDAFEMASDVYVVQKENKVTGLFEDLTVRVASLHTTESGYTLDDHRKILFKDLDMVVDLGLRFKFGGFTWLTVDTSNILSVTQSCIVRRCNDILKWKTISGSTVQYDCTVKLLSDRSIDIRTSNDIETPFGKILVEVPYNVGTSSIKLEQRFLFKQSAYIVVGKDDVSKVFANAGYISLVLDHSGTSQADDFINQIADNSILYGGGSSGNPPTDSGGDYL